ncbi:zf-HC2 domain-containing protein, partial [Streptomyces sp. NPDC052644]
MGRPERHDAVGAYALGVLEPYDELCCAEHVARCASCALRLVELAEVASALAQLTGRTPLSPPPRRRCAGARWSSARRRRVRSRRPAPARPRRV